MKTKRSFTLISVCIFLVLVVSLAAGACSNSPAPATNTPPTSSPATAEQEVITLKWQTNLPAGMDDFNWWDTDMGSLPKLVEEGSGGRLVIDIYGNGEIVPVPEELSATGTGVVDMMMCGSPYWAGVMPAALFGMQAFTLSDMVDMNSYLRPGYIDLMRPEYAKQNTQLLTIGFCNQGYLVSKKAINTIDDFNGLKMRVTGLPGDILATIGAAPVMIGANECYTSLQSGVIDAATFGGPVVMKSLGLNEVTDYLLVDPPLIALAFDIAVNMDTWNSLPDDLKWVLEKAAVISIDNFANWSNINDSRAIHWFITEGGLKPNYLNETEKAKLTEMAMSFLKKYSEKDAVSGQAYNQLEELINSGLLDR